MKKTLLLLGLVSVLSNSYAQDIFTIGDGVDAPESPNCFAVAMFEEKLTTEQALSLCAYNDPAPVFCYRFAKRVGDLGAEGAIEVCAKTPSMMKTIDCLTDNSELDREDLIEMCKVQ